MMKLLCAKQLLLASFLLHVSQSDASQSLRGTSKKMLDESTVPAPAPSVDDIQPLLAEYVASQGSTSSNGATDLMNWQPRDCSTCNDTCKWNDLACFRDMIACKAYQSPMNFLMMAIETACRTDPKRKERRDLIQDAKVKLDDHGIFTLDELDSVKFHFCNLDAAGNDWLGLATGLTLSPNKVVFEYNYLNATAEDLAILMAHEMVHIKQYRRWGSEIFSCRYSKEIEDGKGFGPENYIEKEAYDLEYVAASTIKSSGSRNTTSL